MADVMMSDLLYSQIHHLKFIIYNNCVLKMADG